MFKFRFLLTSYLLLNKKPLHSRPKNVHSYGKELHTEKMLRFGFLYGKILSDEKLRWRGPGSLRSLINAHNRDYEQGLDYIFTVTLVVAKERPRGYQDLETQKANARMACHFLR